MPTVPATHLEPGTTARLIEQARAERTGHIAQVRRALRHVWDFGDQHSGHIRQQAAMRSGRARRLPTVFGGL